MSHRPGPRLDDEDFASVGMQIKVKASLALFKNLALMLKQQQFCDLVFELTGSMKFHAHRLVLALWSPVMMNLLNQSSCRVEKVLVKTHLQDAFKQFVQFLYTGTFEGNITDIDGVLLLASTFQIPLLRSLCEKQLQQRVSVENVIGIFHTSVRYKLSFLEKQCVEHIQDHLPEVAQQSELKDLNPEQFNSFMASQHVSQLNPEMKLFLIISWLTEHVNERQHFLVLLLRHIDWSTVAQDFLTEISQTENFFTSHPSSLYLLLQTLHSASISLGPYTDRFEELRSEYSEILNHVVTNSANIGNGRQEIFQPIGLTLISGLTKENEKTLPESKKTVKLISSRDKGNSKTVKSKQDVSNNTLKAVKKNNPSSNTGGSRKRMNNTSGKKNEKGKESVNKITRSETSSSNQNKEISFAPSTPVNRVSTRTSAETGSMRRKTLRPRKVVSSSSGVSIVSPSYSNRTVSTRRSTALQRAGVENNGGEKEKSSTSSAAQLVTGTTTQQENEEDEDGDEEDHNDNPSTKTEEDEVPDDDNDEDYIQPASLRQTKKNPPKILTVKPKMGRPRKGFERSKFTCSECEYVTRHAYLLHKHNRLVHESKRIIKCPICAFQCNWSKKLYTHMRNDHYNNSGPPYACDIKECSYTNDKMNKLVEHRRSHTDDRPFICEECKMAFRSKSNLYAHLKCHNDKREFGCPICNQWFKMKITLEQHMVVHNDSRPYLCDLCGFSTKYQAHLKAHRRKHTGDVYPCTFPSCTYSTPKKSTLQAHMRSHLGIRHHICPTCNKAFIEKSHLVRHMRIHSSDKQHKCPKCDYASHRLDKLREHLQKHEREANRNSNNDSVATGNGEGTSVPSEPKKRKRKKKVETVPKQTSSKKVKDFSTSSLTLDTVPEYTPTSISVASNISPPPVPHNIHGTILRSDANNDSNHTMITSDSTVGIDRASTISSISETGVGVEAGTHLDQASNARSYDIVNNDNPDTAVVAQLPPLKLEKDMTEVELLARMGFTVTPDVNIPTVVAHATRSSAGVQHRGEEVNTSVVESSTSVPMSNSQGSSGNGLTEFTDIYRGFDTLPPTSTSMVAISTTDGRSLDTDDFGSDHVRHHHYHPHHQPHHYSHHPVHSEISLIPSDEERRLVEGSGHIEFTHGPPPHPQSVVLSTGSYPTQEEVETSGSLHARANSGGDPHPIIMIPNMNPSGIASPQTYLHHHPQPHHHQSQHQHHRHHQQQLQQRHEHPQHPSHQQLPGDDEHLRYHHHHQRQQQQHSHSSSPPSSLSHQHPHHHRHPPHHLLHHQQQQQQPGDPSGQNSSSYPHYTGFPPY